MPFLAITNTQHKLHKANKICVSMHVLENPEGGGDRIHKKHRLHYEEIKA